MYEWYKTALYVPHEAVCKHACKFLSAHTSKVCCYFVLINYFALIGKLNLYFNVVYFFCVHDMG